ncbi:MAG: hypothetical protein RLZZ458_1749 [Planctomycetota bacterium]
MEVVEGADAMFPAGAVVFINDGDALFGGVGSDERAGGGRFGGRSARGREEKQERGEQQPRDET